MSALHFQKEDEAEGSSRRQIRGAIEWVVIIGAALLAAFLIKTFLIQAFFIPSESMVPQLKKGDRVLVNKLSYHLHDVHRGDIVVFERPPSEPTDPQIKDLIKRVIGLPGETVSGDNSGHVLINGKRLNEPYLPKGVTTTGLQEYKIPPHHYWVMGDNRGNSKDSRYFSAIDDNLIVGRAFIRVWPVSSIGLL
ncbi:MAG: signal peptidase [Actinomycetota bacterium]|nr:signal peptidase [Actinomycetota bacterium]